jgi:dihydrodipicolinate synthase/N-acetylneuraminate lyase
MIPALKSVVAYYSKNVNWETVRPPLVSLKKETQKELIQKLADLHFDMS